MEQTYALIDQAVALLRSQGFGKAKAALILGSGLGSLADTFREQVAVDYKDVPGFGESTVAGHAGRLVYGLLAGVPVVAMQGRYHFYEGHSQRQIAFALWVMRELGASTLVVTNAAGGLNPKFSVGDLMLITDHINMTGGNPLIGPNPDGYGPRFPDMSQAYTKALGERADKIALEMGFSLQRGVYLAVSGPAYETPAEIKSFARLGADAVGMSTVPEVIIAKHAGMEVLGLSCITNLAAGLGAAKLDHHEVIEVTQRVEKRFVALVTRFVGSLKEEN
jgi:purine-nucleoside phosphorylase